MTIPRLVAAVLAASITLALFSAVVSIAPPERHVLLARSQQATSQPIRQAATPAALAPSAEIRIAKAPVAAPSDQSR